MSRQSYNAAYYAANRERLSTRAYERYLANPIKMHARTAGYRAADPEKVRNQRSAYYAKDPKKQCARVATYRILNRQKINAKNARRRARSLAQLCVCCSAADIRIIYEKCPASSEVDHRIPLALGGLHCRHNLQILSEAAHIRKTIEDIRDIAAFRAACRALLKC